MLHLDWKNVLMLGANWVFLRGQSKMTFFFLHDTDAKVSNGNIRSSQNCKTPLMQLLLYSGKR